MVQNPFHGELPWNRKMKFGPRRLKHIDSDNLACFDATMLSMCHFGQLGMAISPGHRYKICVPTSIVCPNGRLGVGRLQGIE
jgi:hypothetical protein